MTYSINQELKLQLQKKRAKMSVDVIKQRFIDKAESEITDLTKEKLDLEQLATSLSVYSDNIIATDITERYNERITFRDEKITKFQQITDVTLEEFEDVVPTIDPILYAEYVIEKEEEIDSISEIEEILSIL
jgi:hypothetical protein